MPPRPRRGSPANRPVHVRVTADELDDLRRVASENGVTTSEFIREAVNEAVSDYRERAVFRSTK